MKFENKHVLITGGSTGIGFGTAKAFIEAGAHVWITGRSEKKLQAAAGKINSDRLHAVVFDTANLNDIETLKNYFVNNNLSLDVLFINAGIGSFDALVNVSEEDFDNHFNINVKGAFFTLQKLASVLKDGSSIILTTSIVVSTASIGTSVYSATKSALAKIAQIAANEFAERKIRVNMVSPGTIYTEGLEVSVPSKDAIDQLVEATHLKRIGMPSDIANAVLFLASEQAAFISGTELLVDGGFKTFALK